MGSVVSRANNRFSGLTFHILHLNVYLKELGELGAKMPLGHISRYTSGTPQCNLVKNNPRMLPGLRHVGYSDLPYALIEASRALHAILRRSGQTPDCEPQTGSFQLASGRPIDGSRSVERFRLRVENFRSLVCTDLWRMTTLRSVTRTSFINFLIGCPREPCAAVVRAGPRILSCGRP